MYNLFYYNISKMSDELFERELSLLDKISQKEILKKSKKDDKKRSLAGKILAKRYISKLYGLAEEDICFEKGENGKPYVLNAPVHFSISHSGTYAVIAISDEPIGVDVEIEKDFSAIVAKRCFNEDELKYISGNSPFRTKFAMRRAFYEIWTAKEAYIKYTGKGLSGGINALSFKLVNGKLKPNVENINLVYDYSIPDCIVAIVTGKK